MTKRLTLKRHALLILAACVVTPNAGAAEPYPQKTVRLIVPAAPGGGLDMLGRALEHELSPMWGESIVVDNRPGAGILVGTEIASRATPDGYTLLMVNSNYAPNLVLQKKLDITRRLTGIVKIANLPTALVVNPSLPVKSVADLIALAKSSHLSYSTTGVGTTSNVCGEMLKLAAKVDITHVPYKGGSPAMGAIISGQVAMGFASLASASARAKTGRLKILAIASAKRSPLAPDVPTIAETVPGVVLETWIGMMAPAGVPAPVLQKINADVAKAVAVPEVSRHLAALGYDLDPGTPAAMNELIASDLATYARVIREAHIGNY